jgi:hypothetical protein
MNPDTPQGLLNKVLFETILYFCRRGRENIIDLEASDFEIKVDADKRRYVVKVKSEQTKNHTGKRNENVTEDTPSLTLAQIQVQRTYFHE